MYFLISEEYLFDYVLSMYALHRICKRLLILLYEVFEGLSNFLSKHVSNNMFIYCYTS